MPATLMSSGHRVSSPRSLMNLCSISLFMFCHEQLGGISASGLGLFADPVSSEHVATILRSEEIGNNCSLLIGRRTKGRVHCCRIVIGRIISGQPRANTAILLNEMNPRLL